MFAQLQWNFAIDDAGCARLAQASAPAGVETITPGEYLITLPLAAAREFGLTADVEGASGFIAATPGDDDGNKPNTVRVLTVRPDNTFGPNPFRLVLPRASLLHRRHESVDVLGLPWRAGRQQLRACVGDLHVVF